MSIWELLGIAPTEDISKIKSAYARQAKQFHPEEHPEEFKALLSGTLSDRSGSRSGTRRISDACRIRSGI